MRILHLADLHLGKTLHELSLIASGDQPAWTRSIFEYIDREAPDAVVIAGDVYDRGVPSREASVLLSSFLTGLADRNIPVMIIAGNHDGGERLEFLSDILKRNNIHIAGVVRREMEHVTLDSGDGLGPVTFWLMPYIFPAAVRQALELDDDTPLTYTESAKALINAQNIDFSARNVLIAHQTVICGGVEPEHSRSETAVGGVGGIDVSAFEGFDYVALGHIHGAQKVGSERVRYAGSPLCYHFSEAGQVKGPLMVTIGAKDEMPVAETAHIQPLHVMRKIMKGSFDEIVELETKSAARGEYVSVALTDELLNGNARDTLAALFESHGCKLLELTREIRRTAGNAEGGSQEAAPDEVSLEELFIRFFRKQTGREDPDINEAKLIHFAAAQRDTSPQLDDDALADELADFALRQEEVK